MKIRQKLLRVLGAAVGFAMILIFPAATWFDLANLPSGFTGAVVAILFMLYGFGGTKVKAKAVPFAGR